MHSLYVPGLHLTPGTSVVLKGVAASPVMTVTARQEDKTGAHCTVRWLDLGAHRREAHIPEAELIRA